MKQLGEALKNISTIEKVLLILTLISVLLKHLLNVRETIDILGFGGTLGILYFPLGFKYIGRPTAGHSFIFGVISGFVYATGVSCLLIGTLKIYGYEYPLIITCFFLGIITVFLLFKLRSGLYPKEYVYAHFLRIMFIVVTNLIIYITFNKINA